MHAITAFLESAEKIQKDLKCIPTATKLASIGAVQQLWKDETYERRTTLLNLLPKTTGYSCQTIDFEVNDLPAYLDPHSLSEKLNNPASFPYGKGNDILDGFIPVREGDYMTAHPRGPLLVIGSGNTLVPVLLSFVYAFLTNNVCVIRSSEANYIGMREILRSFQDAAINAPPFVQKALKLAQQSTVIINVAHTSTEYKTLLEEGPFHLVHFWGGGEALSFVRQCIMKNPAQPRLLVNGPLTGVVIIDSESVSDQHERIASEIAFNMAIFEQKLCSSPTECYFVGSEKKCMHFAQILANHAMHNDRLYPHTLETDLAIKTQLVRTLIKREGATVITPESGGAEWTIVVSKGSSVIDRVVTQKLKLSIYERTKFLEMIAVDTMEEAADLIRTLPARKCHKGIEKVGTVGYAMDFENAQKCAHLLSGCGVYRIVPVTGIFGRGSFEPADGVCIPREYTYLAYFTSAEATEKFAFWTQVRGRWKLNKK